MSAEIENTSFDTFCLVTQGVNAHLYHLLSFISLIRSVGRNHFFAQEWIDTTLNRICARARVCVCEWLICFQVTLNLQPSTVEDESNTNKKSKKPNKKKELLRKTSALMAALHTQSPVCRLQGNSFVWLSSIWQLFSDLTYNSGHCVTRRFCIQLGEIMVAKVEEDFDAIQKTINLAAALIFVCSETVSSFIVCRSFASHLSWSSSSSVFISNFSLLFSNHCLEWWLRTNAIFISLFSFFFFQLLIHLLLFFSFCLFISLSISLYLDPFSHDLLSFTFVFGHDLMPNLFPFWTHPQLFFHCWPFI